VVIARLGGVDSEIERGWVLPCEIKKRTRCARYWSATEEIGGGHGSDVFNEREVVIARLGGVDSEIEPGGGFCPVKLKSDRTVLSIGLQRKRLAGVMVVVSLTRGRW